MDIASLGVTARLERFPRESRNQPHVIEKQVFCIGSDFSSSPMKGPNELPSTSRWVEQGGQHQGPEAMDAWFDDLSIEYMCRELRLE